MAKLKFPDRKRTLKSQDKAGTGTVIRIRRRTLYIWAACLPLGITVNLFINAPDTTLIERIIAGAILGAMPAAFLLWILRDIDKNKGE